MRCTRSRTGACRWEVPSSAVPARARAATCSGRTLEGPEPNLPSAGSSPRGISILGESPVTGRSDIVVQDLGGSGYLPDRAGGRAYIAGAGPDQAGGALLLQDVRRPAGGARAREHR